jgi:hypothetical protein
MRLRTLLIIVAAALMAAFVLLNWQVFTLPSSLNLGWETVNAPLGLVMLGVLALATAAYLIASAAGDTRNLMDARQHQGALQAQRDLAERAEASRFTDLRTELESHLRETRHRDTQAASEVSQAVERIQRDLRNQGEQIQRVLAMRLGEMEARLEGRLDAARAPGADFAVDPAAAPQRSPEARTRSAGVPVPTHALPAHALAVAPTQPLVSQLFLLGAEHGVQRLAGLVVRGLVHLMQLLHGLALCRVVDLGSRRRILHARLHAGAQGLPGVGLLPHDGLEGLPGGFLSGGDLQLGLGGRQAGGDVAGLAAAVHAAHPALCAAMLAHATVHTHGAAHVALRAMVALCNGETTGAKRQHGRGDGEDSGRGLHDG